MHPSWRRKSTLLSYSLALLGWSTFAAAQLPPDIYTTPRPLTAQQVSVLKDHVEKNLTSIKSKDSRALADARRSLLEPFRRDTSRTFRMAYNDALTPGLAAVVSNESATMASRQTALWILGSVASDESDAALRGALEAEQASFRYAAATGFERSMQAIRQDRATYPNPLLSEKNVARYLREAIGKETDAEVLRAMVSAAATLPTAATAIDTISDALVAQVRLLRKADGNGRLHSIRIGLERMQKRYVVDMFGGQAIAPHERQMVEAACSALLLTVRHGSADKITSDQSALYIDLARTCENLLNLLCKRDSTQTRVTSALSAGRYDDAEQAMNSLWLAADGPIYGTRLWEIPSGSIEATFDR